MPTIHYLNVKQGDCSVIQHFSDHVSVIDVCNASITDPIKSLAERLVLESAEKGLRGNFNQKEYPVNPIQYLRDRNIRSVFRFILTNPDMDHMDGLRAFFSVFGPGNLWDTDNREEKEFEPGSPYSKDDWLFYKSLRDGKPTENPRRLTLYSGACGQFWNRGEDGQPGGDGLHVLAPTPELLAKAIETGDYNDASYVLLYRTCGRRVLFSGDSHDATWEYVLEKHKDDVQNVDLLIAPHHGRHSDRSFEFLDVVRPRLTFFGNASSEHLAYSAWSNRDLPVITNNQAGCMIVTIAAEGTMQLLVTHKPFAERLNARPRYSDELKAYYCGEL